MDEADERLNFRTGMLPEVTVRALFVLDPLDRLCPREDSTYVMMLEAQRRGYEVHGTMVSDLALEGEVASAHARPVAPISVGDRPSFAGASQQTPLSQFDVVFQRKDPPFDSNYLISTWILERARGQTLLVNDPAGLRELNEKLAILAFSHLTPRTRLLRRREDLHTALDDFGGEMIVKPVFGFGGRAILKVRRDDPNLNALLELATQEHSEWTVAQEFLPEAKTGDKRILLVDGEPVGAVLRVPAKGEGRSNFHVGGTAAATALSPHERTICDEVGPFLAERGQFFVGLDVIGEKLTEVNVTSPTGMQEVNRMGELTGHHTMEARFWDGVERRLKAR
jgi:glutathione synthase